MYWFWFWFWNEFFFVFGRCSARWMGPVNESRLWRFKLCWSSGGYTCVGTHSTWKLYSNIQSSRKWYRIAAPFLLSSTFRLVWSLQIIWLFHINLLIKKFSFRIKPICLPVSDSNRNLNYDNFPFVVAGWGKVSLNSIQIVLMISFKIIF